MRGVSLLSMMLLAGCSLVPFYEIPAVPVPEQWAGQTVVPVAPPQLAWEQFGSNQLPALVVKALANNQDVEVAAARVEQARAQAVISGGALYPAVSASGSAQHSDTQVRNQSNSSNDSARSGLDVSYEVDLWGRIRAGRDAANARFVASQFDRDSVALSVATETARNYLSLAGTEAQLNVARENLVVAEDLLKIVEAQFKEGRISELEVAQQRVVLANVRASIASLERTRDSFRNALAVLEGEAASSFTLPVEDFSGFTNPVISPSLPSELIMRRPDIRRVEASLQAANFDVGAARAALLPSLSISAGAAVAANPSSVVLDGLASLSAPIFKGGALEASVELSEAKKREMVASYRQIILTSFQEVETALSTRQAAVERQQNLEAAVVSAQQAYALAKTRYVNGATDFQALLNTQQSLFSAQSTSLQVKLDGLSATLDLFRALGGDVQKN